MGDDHGPVAGPERLQRDAHRVTGAPRIILDTAIRGRHRGPDRVLAGRGHNHHPGRAQRVGGGEHMADQRPAANQIQDLRPGRIHTAAFARGEYDN